MRISSPCRLSTQLSSHTNTGPGLLFCIVAFLLAPAANAFAEPAAIAKADTAAASEKTSGDDAQFEEATFGSGCFWCGEAVFQQLKGVKSVVSGYSGGLTKYPTYEQVSTGETGHAEVIHVTFDPNVITFKELLEVFWKTHDPTTLNRQGPDYGTQYRSAIFYHNETQKELAEEYKKKLEAAKAFKRPIVTEITAFKVFYPAEDYHQNYYRNHPDQPYCTAIIQAKVNKVKSVFKDKLNKEPKSKK